jgi:glycogen operon protein
MEENHDLLRFFSELIAFRKRHSCLQRRSFFTGDVNARGLADIAWHGCQLGSPGWNDPDSHVLAFTLGGVADEPDLHIMLNMDWQELAFDLPQSTGRQWFRTLDTALAAPEDIAEAGEEIVISGDNYLVHGRSVVVLIAK